MKYIVGLGNPGAEYNHTRHNVGRDMVFAYAEAVGLAGWSNNKPARALVSVGQVGAEPIELVLPETFMNRSGDTVRYLLEKQKVAPEALIVVHDDVDLPLGEFKISVDRGHGGHNGLKSIEAALGSRAFVRVRVGVAKKSFWTGQPKRPSGGEAMSKYVLGRFSKSEQSVVDELLPDIFAAVNCVVNEGVQKAMNQFN